MPRNPEVEVYLSRLDHPHKHEIARVREIILGVDARIDETIELTCPTFSFRSVIASIVMRTNSHVQLTFHQGTLLPDASRLLEGNGRLRSVRFRSIREISDKKAALETLVRQSIRRQLTS